MNNYLYRYMSFEMFIGMIQSQSLTFVLPEVWEDPKESAAFYRFIESKDNIYEQMLFVATYYKTYAQCWTTLDESDAMWRIYGYNCRALRIKISCEKAEKLEGVHIVPVQYCDNLENYLSNLEKGEKEFLGVLSQKRTAFEHEKEIRMITYYRFSCDKDFENHVKAMLVLGDHKRKVDILQNLFPDMSIEEQVDNTCKLLNLGKEKEITKSVSFSNIPNFIEGVMVHPMAPEWYVKIVSDYCDLNNIMFEGKSKLYE